MADFLKALEITLRHEGGTTVDTGGYTKWGISQKAYPTLDIKNMTRQQMQEIYRRDYWNKIFGDQIKNQEAAAVLFDYAVNAGVGAAVKAAQNVLGFTGKDIDGGMGPKTLDALNAAGQKFGNKLTEYRIGFYTRLANSDPAKYGKYLAGWIKRAQSFFNVTPAKAGGGALVLLAFAGAFFWYTRTQGEGKKA